ncbi:Transcription factor MYB44 [Dendrobium catenatum]|uniref:Transcription factor MYB44 n=1 Tax=Dendrobium catenatum TaxID=906689 RepID=A0A2I0VJJ5_9ASPA|nr:Transcription factor MYB44 [Dendrobium catenatum]
MGLSLASPPPLFSSIEKNSRIKMACEPLEQQDGFFSGEVSFVSKKNFPSTELESREHETRLSKLCSRGHWRPAEDAELKKLVALYGPQNWNLIAEKLEGRSGKSCRLRWYNQLDPRINRNAFTKEEEQRLLSAHKCYGNKWALIARLFPWRTDNAVKNHWHVIMARRQRVKSDAYRRRKQSNSSCIKSSCISGSTITSNKDEFVAACTDLSLSSSFTSTSFHQYSYKNPIEYLIGSDGKLVAGRTDHSDNSDPEFESSLTEPMINQNINNFFLKNTDHKKKKIKLPFIDFLGVGAK